MNTQRHLNEMLIHSEDTYTESVRIFIIFLTDVVLFTKNFYCQDRKLHAFYKDILERLRKRVQQVQKDIAVSWMLHHDNAPTHTALSIREFLANKNTLTLPHPTAQI
jgi:hypothetical protein